MDQAILIEELRKCHFSGMPEEQQTDTINGYREKDMYAWGKILSIDENYIHLNAKNSKEEFSISCEYRDKSKRENLNLHPDEFICIKMKVDKVSFAFYNDCEIWSIYGFYDGLSIKKINFYQRQFEARTKQVENEKSSTEKIKRKKEINEEKSKDKAIKNTDEKVKSKKEINEGTIKRYETENRKIDRELEEKKALVGAFRSAVLISLFFLFCMGFYKLHAGHNFFDGISIGTITIAIIIGIVVFVRSNR